MQQIEQMAVLCEVLVGVASGVQATLSNQASAAAKEAGPVAASNQEPLQAGDMFSAEDAMAKLCAEAEAAMARDFAATWNEAVADAQAGTGMDEGDVGWLADVGPVAQEPCHSAGANDAAGNERLVEEQAREGRDAAFWKSLCLDLRAVLVAAVQVLPSLLLAVVVLRGSHWKPILASPSKSLWRVQPSCFQRK